jgi:hypothetical protein
LNQLSRAFLTPTVIIAWKRARQTTAHVFPRLAFGVSKIVRNNRETQFSLNLCPETKREGQQHSKKTEKRKKGEGGRGEIQKEEILGLR